MTLRTLSKPCVNCPFKTGGWLRAGRRREIAMSLLEDQWFACHATVDYSEDEGPGSGEEWWEEPEGQVTDRSKECAGAVVISERSGFVSQYRRIMERVGNVREVDGSEIPWQSLEEWVAQGEIEEEWEPCSVVDAQCEAPAGFASGGGVTSFESGGETNECPGCGEPVCESCMDGEEMCPYCIER